MDRRSIFQQRAEEAIAFGLESPTVEFKGSQPFDVLKFKIARTAQAMANNRDGGLIIIGVPNDRTTLIPTGMDEIALQTYNYDILYEFINGYATPAIEFQMVRITIEVARYIVIQVPAMGRSPTICRKNTPPSVTRSGEKMAEGDVFIRTRDRIGTSRVTNASMIDDLLNTAASRRAAELLELLGSKPSNSKPIHLSRYDQEVEDLDEYL